MPVIADEGPFVAARWVHAPNGPDDQRVAEALVALAASMPPVCTLGSGADVDQMFDRLVDGIARGLLAQSGWRAELGKQRRPDLQALRATFGALSKPDYVIRGNTDGFDVALDHLRDELDRHRRRAGGEPVVVPRLRLDRARRPACAVDRAARTRRRQRLVPLVHRERRVGSKRSGPRRRTRRAPPRSARPTPSPTPSTQDRVHPRPGRPRARTRTDGRRTRPRRRRGLHRHRARRTAAPRHRTDRAGAPRAHTCQRQRRSHARTGRRPQEAVRPRGARRLDDGGRRRADLRSRTRPRRGGRIATLLHTGHRWVRIDADELRRKRQQLHGSPA